MPVIGGATYLPRAHRSSGETLRKSKRGGRRDGSANSGVRGPPASGHAVGHRPSLHQGLEIDVLADGLLVSTEYAAAGVDMPWIVAVEVDAPDLDVGRA